jgi:hypothetical protein
MGHKVRFRVMDQGAKYGFVCNQSLGDCLVIETDCRDIINLETTTDCNGDAFAVIRADVNAPTHATISAIDQATGHVLRKRLRSQAPLSSLGTGTDYHPAGGDGSGYLPTHTIPALHRGLPELCHLWRHRLHGQLDLSLVGKKCCHRRPATL